MNSEKILMAGFGTLLLQESLGDSIGQDGAQQKKFRPIIVKNYRRLFNLKPDHYPADNRFRTDNTECGAANIEPANGLQFNGLCFEADASNLENLDKRERYYIRTAVECFDFYTGVSLGECFVYESPLDARWLVRDVAQLIPLWRDIVYARVGSYRIGKDFGKMYDATTYLADGKTLLVDFYKDYLAETLDLAAVRK